MHITTLTLYEHIYILHVAVLFDLAVQVFIKKHTHTNFVCQGTFLQFYLFDYFSCCGIHREPMICMDTSVCPASVAPAR